MTTTTLNSNAKEEKVAIIPPDKPEADPLIDLIFSAGNLILLIFALQYGFNKFVAVPFGILEFTLVHSAGVLVLLELTMPRGILAHPSYTTSVRLIHTLMLWIILWLL